jgi:hypothetical protein
MAFELGASIGSALTSEAAVVLSVKAALAGGGVGAGLERMDLCFAGV